MANSISEKDKQLLLAIYQAKGPGALKAIEIYNQNTREGLRIGDFYVRLNALVHQGYVSSNCVEEPTASTGGRRAMEFYLTKKGREVIKPFIIV